MNIFFIKMSNNNNEVKKYPLKKEEAQKRKLQLTNSKGEYHVLYDLILTLRQLKDKNIKYPENNFEGRLKLKFSYNDKNQEDIFLNFSGTIFSITVNSKIINFIYKNKRIYIKHTDLILNDINEVIILFSSKYDKTRIGLHHFIDPSDNNEYLYTQFCPFECNLVFPVFDQPDIKSTLKLSLIGINNWVMLSNEKEILKWKIDKNSKENDKDCEKLNDIYSSLTNEEFDFLFESIYNKNYMITLFETTPKISSYLFAICAGPYFSYLNPYIYKIPIRIFMRQSLKFKGEIKEVFKSLIYGMEYYKKYFGISFPFSKYDQLYAPEFNFGAMENVGLVTYNEYYCFDKNSSKNKISKYITTVLHELSHIWFGNLVTMNCGMIYG